MEKSATSRSDLEEEKNYVATQEEHHRQRGFGEEYRAFLTRHEIAFDERYLLG